MLSETLSVKGTYFPYKRLEDEDEKAMSLNLDVSNWQENSRKSLTLGKECERYPGRYFKEVEKKTTQFISFPGIKLVKKYDL